MLVAGYLWFTKPDNQPNEPLANSNFNENLQQYLSVDFLFDNQQIISLQYPYSSSVNEDLLTITENLAVGQSWPFQVENYGEMGVLITQINNKINGQDQKYWQYYSDGQMPMVSVDKYFPKISEKIEWKFQESEF